MRNHPGTPSSEGSPRINSLDFSWDGTLREKQSLHFFCVISAPELSGFLDTKFWQTLLPQASQLDQAIKHAVAALGASHEHQLRMQASRLNAETDGLHPFALRQCNKAIKNLIKPTKKMSQHDLMRALTASVLFASFESLSGNRDGAIPHVVHSRRLLEQYKSNQKDSNGFDTFPVDLDIIEPLVAHYEVQIGSYVYESDPEGMIKDFDPDVALEFHRLADARVSLERSIANLSIVLWSLHDHHGPEDVAAVAKKKAKYASWLKRWDTAFSNLLAKNSANFDRETVDGCRLLKAHQVAVTTLTDVDYYQGEQGWAAFNPRYQIIVDLIGAIIDNLPKRGLSAQAPQMAYISSAMGITEPLYLTSTRCTDAVIAEKARSLMKKLPQNEGVHSAWKTEYIEKTLCAATGKFHQSPPQEGSSLNIPNTRVED